MGNKQPTRTQGKIDEIEYQLENQEIVFDFSDCLKQQRVQEAYEREHQGAQNLVPRLQLCKVPGSNLLSWSETDLESLVIIDLSSSRILRVINSSKESPSSFVRGIIQDVVITPASDSMLISLPISGHLEQIDPQGRVISSILDRRRLKRIFKDGKWIDVSEMEMPSKGEEFSLNQLTHSDNPYRARIGVYKVYRFNTVKTEFDLRNKKLLFKRVENESRMITGSIQKHRQVPMKELIGKLQALMRDRGAHHYALSSQDKFLVLEYGANYQTLLKADLKELLQYPGIGFTKKQLELYSRLNLEIFVFRRTMTIMVRFKGIITRVAPPNHITRTTEGPEFLFFKLKGAELIYLDSIKLDGERLVRLDTARMQALVTVYKKGYRDFLRVYLPNPKTGKIRRLVSKERMFDYCYHWIEDSHMFQKKWSAVLQAVHQRSLGDEGEEENGAGEGFGGDDWEPRGLVFYDGILPNEEHQEQMIRKMRIETYRFKQ